MHHIYLTCLLNRMAGQVVLRCCFLTFPLLNNTKISILVFISSHSCLFIFLGRNPRSGIAREYAGFKALDTWCQNALEGKMYWLVRERLTDWDLLITSSEGAMAACHVWGLEVSSDINQNIWLSNIQPCQSPTNYSRPPLCLSVTKKGGKLPPNGRKIRNQTSSHQKKTRQTTVK